MTAFGTVMDKRFGERMAENCGEVRLPMFISVKELR
jgi:hypothetical protein